MADETLVMSTGDPQGIGPEVSIRAAAKILQEDRRVRIELVGTRPRLEQAGLLQELKPHINHRLTLATVPGDLLPLGKPSAEGGDQAFRILQRAFTSTFENRGCRALVTAPVSKQAIHRKERPFNGHTGWLGEQCGIQDPLMLFWTPRFKLALATVHVPLRQVPQMVTTQLLGRRLLQLRDGLRDSYGIRKPSVAVLGLNPHSGEGGLLGEEEQQVISPLLARLQGTASDSLTLSGPHPADSFFSGGGAERVDAVLALYHDQGLVAVKSLAPREAVNVTLGLPIIRTSVDHGCAFDLAGCGTPDSRSMVAAARHALELLRLQA